ncbi:MAG: GNAT family N-acetyltransferase [Cyanobacteria bacterium J06623_7]
MSEQKLGFSIRPYKREDSDAVKQLCCESLRILGANVYSPRQIEALVSRYSTELHDGQTELINNIFAFIETIAPLDTDKPNIVVAHLEERIIGYASIIVGSGWFTNDSLLAELFVHPEYTRRGIGTKLLQTLEANVTDNSQVIKIGATLIGESFYQANGYRMVERHSSFFNGVRIPFVSMEKWLTPPSEIEKIIWDTSQQGVRNIEWLATETEALFRGIFEA